LPLECTAEILVDLYAIMSESTIEEVYIQVAKQVEPVTLATKEELIVTDGTVHFNETWGDIDGKLWWLHVMSTTQITSYGVYLNLACKAVKAIGILPVFKGMVMHDSYRSCFQYQEVINALCNAHQARDLIFINERFQQTWSFDMEKLLLVTQNAIAAIQPDQDCLPATQITDSETHSDTIIAAGLQTNLLLEPAVPVPKKRSKSRQFPAKNPLKHFQTCNREHWLFCMILKCHLITTGRSVISACSNSSRMCRWFSLER
jgi:transposase